MRMDIASAGPRAALAIRTSDSARPLRRALSDAHALGELLGHGGFTDVNRAWRHARRAR